MGYLLECMIEKARTENSRAYANTPRAPAVQRGSKLHAASVRSRHSAAKVLVDWCVALMESIRLLIYLWIGCLCHLCPNSYGIICKKEIMFVLQFDIKLNLNAPSGAVTAAPRFVARRLVQLIAFCKLQIIDCSFDACVVVCV